MASLSTVKSAVEHEGRLRLDADTLGPGFANALNRLIGQQTDFILTDCSKILINETNNVLTFRGTLTDAFGWGTIGVDFALFDLPSGQRHGAFRVDVPAGSSPEGYLARYRYGTARATSSRDLIAGSGLEEFVDNVRFTVTFPIVVSSLDYRVITNDVFFPDFLAPLSKRQIKIGVNFFIESRPESSFYTCLTEMLGAQVGTTGMTHGLITMDGDTRYLVLSGDLTGARIGSDGWSLAATEVSIAAALSPEAELAPLLSFIGEITLDGHRFDVGAEWNPFTEELALSVRNLPSLREITASLVKDPSLSTSFPALLDVRLSTVSVVLDLAAKSVAAVQFELTHNNPLPLIDGVISVKPSLSMRISAPFDADSRAVKGVLRGDWEFGNTVVETTLYYPSFDISVALAENSSLKLGDLLQTFTRKTQNELQIDNTLWNISLTTMTLEGNFQQKRLSADIAVQIDWTISLSGQNFTLDNLSMWMGYENGGFAYWGMAAAMRLPGVVSVTVSGEWAEGSGWTFEGRTGTDEDIPIGRLVQAVVPGAKLPDPLLGFKIRNLSVAFNTKSKNFSFYCEGSLPLDDGRILSGWVSIQSGSPQFSGAVMIAGAEFTLQISAAQGGTSLLATWQGDGGKPAPDLKSLSREYRAANDSSIGQLSALDWPIPKSAKVEIDFGKKSLSLDCVLSVGTTGTAAAGFLAMKGGDGSWIGAAALLLPDLTTAGMTSGMGPLGEAMDQHAIALRNPVIVAASGSVQGRQLSFGGQTQPVLKGLFLGGELSFANTTFKQKFECRLLGDPDPTPVPPAPPSTQPVAPALLATTPEKPPNPAGEQAANNVPVGRTIGPVTFRKARFDFREQRIYVLFDASLGAAGIGLDLYGFNLNFPLTAVTNPAKLAEMRVGLEGLGINYSKPPLTIAGSLIKRGEDWYEGDLLIKAQSFQVGVLGSYRLISIDGTEGGKKVPSLFIFGTFSGVLGGPPAFFVTGLALGGGYNRRLIIPPVEEISRFPLITAVTNPTSFNECRDAMATFVPPSYGDYWLAAGVRFTSFKMADSFALFSVSFGNRLQFALTGLTVLSVPPAAPTPAVRAELAIRAVLDPDAGVLSIEGRLTTNSYIFTDQLRLTGGFAFFVWFGNAKEAGDFVITLGGYHPQFPAPLHYPVVPRVGIRGQLSTMLSFAGEAYLAITPSCVMGGLRFEAAFAAAGLRAAFLATADFVVAWAPFHYDARIGIAISITYQPVPGDDATGSALAIKLEIAAELHVWGPPFAGIATISFGVFSASVEFGEQGVAKPKPLKWDAFKTQFLPPAEAGEPALATIRVAEGVLREIKNDKGEVTARLVNAHELRIETDSVVPCTQVSLGTDTAPGGASVGIRPMRATKLDSTHDVSIHKRTSQGGTLKLDPVTTRFERVRWTTKNHPEALWSPEEAPGTAQGGMIKGVPAGVLVRARRTLPEHRLGPFNSRVFAEELIPKNIALGDQPPPSRAPAPDLAAALAASASLQSRVRDHLASRRSGWNTGACTVTGAKLAEIFQAPPQCAALGSPL
jgi:hypothetical protein